MCHLEIIEEELSKLKTTLRDLAEERQSLRLKEKEKITKETEINLLDAKPIEKTVMFVYIGTRMK